MSGRRQATLWVALAGAVLLASWAFSVAGLPAPTLFAALLVGLVAALSPLRSPELPPPAFAAAQAVVGVTLGTYLHADTLASLGTRWIPVVLVSLATLGVTTASGLLLGRMTEADPVTASLGTVAGGASGIVAMAGSLGGDDRLVAFMQYLRVLVVLLITPILVSVAFGAHGGAPGPANDVGLLTPLSGWPLVVIGAPLGVWLGRLTRLPAGTLLGPLILVAIGTLSGLTGSAEPPALLRDGSFALIGLAIGLRFTRAEMRVAGRLLPAVLASIAGLIVACFALGALLSSITGVSALDGYLATTPGGLYAVLPIAFGSGANTTFVLAVQALRLFVMILAAPLVTQRILRGRIASSAHA